MRRARPLDPQRADTIQTEPPKLGRWPGLVEKYTKPEHGISFRDMQERMLLSEAVDTLRCFDEGLHYLHYHYKALVTFFDNALRGGGGHAFRVTRGWVLPSAARCSADAQRRNRSHAGPSQISHGRTPIV